VSNDGHCVVCDAQQAIEQSLGAITRTTLAAYIEGLDDEGVAQRDRFCLAHRAAFDVQIKDTEHGRFP